MFGIRFLRRPSRRSAIAGLLVSPGLLHFKQPAISQAAFDNLKEVKNRLPLEDNTLIIARHGLEWWAGWALHCKTGNEKGVDSETPGKYRQVLFLHQKEWKGRCRRGTCMASESRSRRSGSWWKFWIRSFSGPTDGRIERSSRLATPLSL